MESYGSPAYYGVVYIILISLKPWSVVGVEVITNQLEKFTKVNCDDSPMCLSSKPCRSFDVSSEVRCVMECLRQKRQPEYCIGVNYRQQKNVCDVFYSDQNVTNLSNFTKNNSGCQYIQRGAVDTSSCSSICVLARLPGKYQYVIDSVDCSFPFTYEGKLFHSCTSQLTGVTNKCASTACLKVNRTSVRCLKPADFVAQYTPTNVTVFSMPTISTMSVFGWIVFQQRTLINPAFNWQRPWSEYKNGFGSIGSNFWLGLERVHLLTSSTKYRLRVEVQQTKTGSWYSAEYWSFAVGDELSSKYKLSVDGFSGDAGDSLMHASDGPKWYHNGRSFTTFDMDNDLFSGNCATGRGGGWWFAACFYASLTCHDSVAEWDTLPNGISVKSSRMMIKVQ